MKTFLTLIPEIKKIGPPWGRIHFGCLVILLVTDGCIKSFE